MTSKEAIHKIDLTIKYGSMTQDELNSYLEYKNIIEKDLEILDWLIEKMYVAGGLIELKVCPPNNPTILKYHNGIETHDERFWNYIDIIHELKYKRK